jgi:hypothetical protein
MGEQHTDDAVAVRDDQVAGRDVSPADLHR